MLFTYQVRTNYVPITFGQLGEFDYGQTILHQQNTEKLFYTKQSHDRATYVPPETHAFNKDWGTMRHVVGTRDPLI